LALCHPPRDGGVMVVLGGQHAAHTDRALSITEWKPVTGIVTPVSEDDWQAE